MSPDRVARRRFAWFVENRIRASACARALRGAASLARFQAHLRAGTPDQTAILARARSGSAASILSRVRSAALVSARADSVVRPQAYHHARRFLDGVSRPVRRDGHHVEDASDRRYRLGSSAIEFRRAASRLIAPRALRGVAAMDSAISRIRAGSPAGISRIRERAEYRGDPIRAPHGHAADRFIRATRFRDGLVSPRGAQLSGSRVSMGLGDLRVRIAAMAALRDRIGAIRRASTSSAADRSDALIALNSPRAVSVPLAPQFRRMLAPHTANGSADDSASHRVRDEFPHPRSPLDRVRRNRGGRTIAPAPITINSSPSITVTLPASGGTFEYRDISDAVARALEEHAEHLYEIVRRTAALRRRTEL